MKICHVVHSLNVGGAEMLVTRMVRLAPPGESVVVACLDEIGPLGEELRREGFVVECVGRRPGLDLGLSGRLLGFLRRHHPHVVHCHQYTPWFYGTLAAARAKLPVVFTEHGRHQPDRPRWRRVLFNKWLLKKTGAVTAVSRSIRQALIDNEKLPPARVQVLYNGVDDALFVEDPQRRARARAGLGVDDDTLAIGTAGRLVGVKNQALLLRALARLHEQDPERKFRAFLAGGGPLEAELRALHRELVLGDRVVFLGERDDVPDLLNAWDIFVLPSQIEGTSITLLEAMSSARPVVATRVGGNPELLEDGVQGFLVPPQDVEAMAAALGRLGDDAALRRQMGEAGRARVRESFTMGAMLDHFNEIHQRVRGGHR